ncbi:MAG TPA: bifunctional oligoribonuclease/PAP phosphatase NrnA, partial [Oceanipulchritudo sp.]|nr:bifunctional oligoribonuclease/PAP phosphatase NrnA [Oceanipulchritudo sp.]
MTALEGIRGKPLAILGHVRPDGDCIGSQVGLARSLRDMGFDVVCYNHHSVPRNCAAFVADTPFFKAAEGVDTDRVAITVDCADRTRLGGILQEAYPEVYLNIDHHISNTCYAEHNIIDGHASATGEILGGILLDNKMPMDPATAQALYVGIATDTGQFRFSSTTRDTFEICCHLMEKGANPAKAAMDLYEQESPAKLALLQRFLASFHYVCDGRVCIGIIDQAAWDATGARKEDTEGLVDYARSIEGVEIGILLEEHEGGLKGSFRAKDPVHRVDQLARQFNGGGHACAAGFNPETTLSEFYPRLVA